VRYNSDYSLALLEWPDAEGWLVEATAHLSLSLKDRMDLATPPDGVAFRFAWVQPDQQGIQTLRQRLKRRLAAPGDWLADSYFIEAALAWPQVASALSIDEILAGMRGREQQRRYLVRYLNTHYADLPAVHEHYLQSIKHRDRWALADLSRTATNVNDARYVEPLMDIFRDDAAAARPLHHDVLRLVARHINAGLVADAAALRHQLGMLTLPRCATIAIGAMPPAGQWSTWRSEVDDLAVTGDVSLIPILRPYLDRSDVVIDATRLANPGNGVSLRACDLAYNAILDLRSDGQTPRVSLDQPMNDDRSAITEQRNLAIGRLRRELDAGGVPNF
jgi:hypothetical protein